MTRGDGETIRRVTAKAYVERYVSLRETLSEGKKADTGRGRAPAQAARRSPSRSSQSPARPR